MIYTTEVQHMCPVAKGAYHGPAPIPEEGKWVQAKEISDISGFTHGVGWCAPQQGACKLTLNVKNGVIEEALVETIGCSGMTHSAAMASEILIGTGSGVFCTLSFIVRFQSFCYIIRPAGIVSSVTALQYICIIHFVHFPFFIIHIPFRKGNQKNNRNRFFQNRFQLFFLLFFFYPTIFLLYFQYLFLILPLTSPLC